MNIKLWYHYCTCLAAGRRLKCKALPEESALSLGSQSCKKEERSSEEGLMAFQRPSWSRQRPG